MSPLLLLACGLAVLDWLAVGRRWRMLEYFAKPATLAAILAWAASGAGTSAWLLLALACGLLGDVFLMLPRDLFTAGLAAFLVGHVAYVVALGAPLPRRLVASALVLLVFAPVGLRILRGLRKPALRGPVVAYAVVLALMTGSALATGDARAAIGGLSFLASDSLLAWGRFVGPAPGGRTAVHVTYHLAQLALTAYLRGA